MHVLHVLQGVVRRVWLYVCDARYVYVHLHKEKELGIFRVWKSIWYVYGIRTKVEAKDFIG